MKKFALVLTALFVMMFLFNSCTENEMVKNYGGTGTMQLPENQKLVTVTWKGDEIWYLTRPMKNDEQAETYNFSEKSSYGIVEGKYIISETKK